MPLDCVPMSGSVSDISSILNDIEADVDSENVKGVKV